MSRLVVFGDSYASEILENKNTWQHILSKNLDCADTISYGLGGTSFQYSLDTFFEYIEKDYQTTDIIVFLISHSARMPYLHDTAKLEWSSFITKAVEGYDDPHATIEECEHWVQFSKEYKFIFEHVMSETRSRMNYFFLRNTIENLKNKHTIIQCFPHVYGMDFNLFDISQSEFKNPTMHKASFDTRPNHLSGPNHLVLANQMFANITSAVAYDVTQFHKNILE